ncbi:hypothetical protein ACWGS9_32535 [Bradyrhizobium sp. Arg314]
MGTRPAGIAISFPSGGAAERLPFGALEALTRLKIQELLLGIWEQFCKTILFVTHDIDEALFLADRIIVTQAIVTSAESAQLKRHCLELLHDHSRTDTLPRLTPLGLGKKNVSGSFTQ